MFPSWQLFIWFINSVHLKTAFITRVGPNRMLFKFMFAQHISRFLNKLTNIFILSTLENLLCMICCKRSIGLQRVVPLFLITMLSSMITINLLPESIIRVRLKFTQNARVEKYCVNVDGFSFFMLRFLMVL